VSGPPRNGPLAGRVAIVTGAAGTIGSATARAIVDAGGQVLATDVRADALESVTAGIRRTHGDAAVATHVADLADPAAPDAIVAAAVERGGGVDVVVHAAMDPGEGRLEQLTVERWDRAQAINVRAAAWLIRAALPHLVPGQASVVLFSSVQAGSGCTGTSLYGTTKGAIETLVRHLAVELGPRGIRINAIAPGWVPSDAVGNVTELAAYPLGRFGRPEEIAATVVFLASAASSWTTGSVMAVDGGTGIAHAGNVAVGAHRAAVGPAGRSWRTRIRRLAARRPG
jgi:NAD(P)-dependent dehydrogenase (short-subunit alcohol dehydrogenase family)